LAAVIVLPVQQLEEPLLGYLRHALSILFICLIGWIAITRPIRIEDAVIVEGEWGWIEEIATTYVVIRIWDWRRLIVPLSTFIEKPFQNWTRESGSIIGSVLWQVDYRLPIEAFRERMVAWLQETYPEALPRLRTEIAEGKSFSPGEPSERALAASAPDRLRQPCDVNE
jgi:hypothetical protein